MDVLLALILMEWLITNNSWGTINLLMVFHHWFLINSCVDYPDTLDSSIRDNITIVHFVISSWISDQIIHSLALYKSFLSVIFLQQEGRCEDDCNLELYGCMGLQCL